MPIRRKRLRPRGEPSPKERTVKNLATYLAWLKWLLALGANVAPLIALLTEFYERLKPLLPALPAPAAPGDDGGLEITQQLCEPTAITEVEQELVADVLTAESEVANLVAGPNAAFDGSRLRALFAFLQSSGLLDVLIKLFAGT